MNLKSLIARLDQDFDRIANDALALAAQNLADDVRQALNTEPGGPHDHPWRQTGALHDSIGSQSEANTAIVGSTSEIARLQEHGTVELPPRPTLAPVAMQSAPTIAASIADAVQRALGQI
jgi:phage gpG-like protein